jgi:uncharacterized protein
MSGENNLELLLQNMKPSLDEEKYVFLTHPNGFSSDIQTNALMLYREQEGMTAIVRSNIAGTLAGSHPEWAKITLTVHSDLQAVGFLAAITSKFASAGISVNPVSAFFHDHLFVPYERKSEALQILQSLQK